MGLRQHFRSSRKRVFCACALNAMHFNVLDFARADPSKDRNTLGIREFEDTPLIGDLEKAMSFTSLLKRPTAIIPLFMSLAAFLLIVAVVSTVGVTYQQDEGAAARIFQLLIVLQVPIIAFFAFKWLPQSPRSALMVLLIQASAAVIPVATIIWLESTIAM